MTETPETPQDPNATGTLQDDPPAPPTPADPEGTVSLKAYKTLQTRLNRANQEKEDLTQALAAAQEDLSRLNDTAENRLSSLTAAQQEKTDLQAELGPLRAMQLRQQAFNELSEADEGLGLSPEATLKLMGLLPQIPVGEDLEATKANIKQFAEFGRSVADQRQHELQEGQTPGVSHQPPGNDLPTTAAEWQQFTEGKGVNSPEMQAFRDWTFSQENS